MVPPWFDRDIAGGPDPFHGQRPHRTDAEIAITKKPRRYPRDVIHRATRAAEDLLDIASRVSAPIRWWVAQAEPRPVIARGDQFRSLGPTRADRPRRHAQHRAPISRPDSHITVAGGTEGSSLITRPGSDRGGAICSGVAQNGAAALLARRPGPRVVTVLGGCARDSLSRVVPVSRNVKDVRRDMLGSCAHAGQCPRLQ
ncbi:MAG: hypothetical protein K0S78_2516 [Thermomicrobiales bacterium]|nr:hypothetical protein [Thermomicrobiales bacterium]